MNEYFDPCVGYANLKRLTKSEAFERLEEGATLYIRSGDGEWRSVSLNASEVYDAKNAPLLEAARKVA